MRPLGFDLERLCLHDAPQGECFAPTVADAHAEAEGLEVRHCGLDEARSLPKLDLSEISIMV